MLNLKGLSGKREAKESTEITPRVRVLNTAGSIRLNYAAGEVLGLEGIDYVAVADAEGTVYIGAGKAHTPELDEKGEVVRTGAGKVKTKGDGYGSKVKASTHSKPHLTFSAAAAWATLRQDSQVDDFKGVLIYELGEGVEASIDTDNEDYPTHVTTMYPLVLKEVKEQEDEEDKVVKEEVSEEEMVAEQAKQTESSEQAEPTGETKEDDEDEDEEW